MRLRIIGYLAALAFFAVVVFPQDKLRKIDEDRYRYKNTPISVTYELGDQPFAFRNETTANSEWLRELNLNVTNISEKTIKSFTIQLIIERQGSMQYQAAMPIRFPLDGEPLLDALGKPTGRYKTHILKPGDSVKLRGPDSVNRHSILETLKNRDGIRDISTVFLDIRYVYFEDGTNWSLGIDFVPDPNAPGRYIRKNQTTTTRQPPVTQRSYTWLPSLLTTGGCATNLIGTALPLGVFFSDLGGAQTGQRFVYQQQGCVWFMGPDPSYPCSLNYQCNTSDARLRCYYEHDETVNVQMGSLDKGHLVATQAEYWCVPDLIANPGDGGLCNPPNCNQFVKYRFVPGGGNGCAMCEDKDGDGKTKCYGGTCSPACDNDCNDDPGGQNQYPGNVESCDGVDNNCNGIVDEGFDSDNDGFKTCQSDCNDNNQYIYPGAVEICDGVDNNCDGQIDEGFDLDGDGYKTCTGDCDDDDPNKHPGATTQDCFWFNDSDCDGITNDMECVWSPIVIDLDGDGFDLTGPANGVTFDLDADGTPESLSWTAIGSDDAWLALDRNGNGRIDDGSELFGNHTQQPLPPPGESENGFLALAVFDQQLNNGNNDGQIDARDGIFSQLRLWTDVNHNGLSENNELRRLSNSPIRILELNYHESRRYDEHGNWFRYRARVLDERRAQVGRWAWDVFLISGASGNNRAFGITRRAFSSRYSCIPAPESLVGWLPSSFVKQKL